MPKYLPGSYGLDLDFLSRLLHVYSIVGDPFVISSGFRSRKYNDLVGGVKDSAHLMGLAADIVCVGSGRRYDLIRVCLNLGFRRIGVFSNYIHVDSSLVLPQSVMFGECLV